MIISSLVVTDFKKHVYGEWQFMPGSNMIVGPNFSGKSSLMEAILIGIWGNSVAPDAAKELIHDGAKDFQIRLGFDNGIVVVRSSKESSLYRDINAEPFARGHSAVNKAMAELIGMSKDVFLKVYASIQGSPQKLLDMEGAELQRFIEQVIGIDKLDAVLKASNRQVASCKDKTEALDYLILPKDEFETLTSDEVQLNQKIVELSHKRKETEEAYELSKTLLNAAADHLSATQTRNFAIERYQTKLQHYQDQLGDSVVQDKTDVAPLEVSLESAEEALRDLKGSNALQTDINFAWRQYRAEAIRIDAALAGIGEEPSYDITGKAAQVTALKADYRAALENENVYRSTLTAYKEASGALAKAEQILLLTPESVLETIHPEQLEDNNTELVKQRAHWATLLDLEHNAVCPTCKRPNEGIDLESLGIEIAEAADTLKKLTETAGAVWEAYNIQQARQLQELKVIECRKAASELEAQYIANQSLLRGTEEIQVKLTAADEELTQMSKHNTRVELQTEERGRLLRKKDKLTMTMPTDPEGDLEDTSDAEAAVVAARDLVRDTKASNKLISEKNAVILDLQKAIAELVPVVGEIVDIAPLDAEVLRLRAVTVEASDAQFPVLRELNEAQSALQAVDAKLTQHREAFDKCKEFYDLADNYRYISQLLSNSRAGFIAKAMATIFSVTTEFAKMGTDGAIEEVVFDDGIKFREAGQGKFRGKLAASGAQKSIMGLGMKLGISNLVLSDFSSILLDEATAAMSEEISLQSSLAMDALCQQSISISHRKMDIAGNVIELGSY